MHSMNDYLKRYQIITIYNTYDLFDKNARVRSLLSDNWGMKLRGYSKYFPYGVLPIDHYDFLCHHILVLDKKQNKVIMGFKSLTKSNCELYGHKLPIKDHLIMDNIEHYQKHSLGIDQWIINCERRGQDLAYSTGFTVEPSLAKEEKVFLTDLLFYLFYHFYTTYKIPNILQAISVRFKLDQRQTRIGFNYLNYENEQLPIIQTKKYDNVESYIMTLDDYGFGHEHIQDSMQVKDLWDNRIEFIGEQKLASSKKAA